MLFLPQIYGCDAAVVVLGEPTSCNRDAIIQTLNRQFEVLEL